MIYDFTRYLAAKKTVDDRALNQHVWHSLATQLASHAQAQLGQPLRVLEIGGGIGTMLERLLEHGLLRHCHYTLVDAEADNIQSALTRLPQWAAQQGIQVSSIQRPLDKAFLDNDTADAAGKPSLPQLHLTSARGGIDCTLVVEQADIFDFVQRATQQGHYDLLIAHAVLDLFDVPQALARLIPLLKAGGLLYATINFDGATILQPELDQEFGPGFDAHIETLYHRSMDERLTNGKPAGDSRTGRHLFGHLRAAGVDLLAAGSSDWVVMATASPSGLVYPGDEGYFLQHILHFMESTLSSHPQLDRARFAAWLAQRRAQIEQGELVYIAHQLDFLGAIPK